MFFFLKIKTRKGYIQAIYDSGSMSCVANEDILVNQDHFLNERCESLLVSWWRPKKRMGSSVTSEEKCQWLGNFGPSQGNTEGRLNSY